MQALAHLCREGRPHCRVEPDHFQSGALEPAPVVGHAPAIADEQGRLRGRQAPHDAAMLQKLKWTVVLAVVAQVNLVAGDPSGAKQVRDLIDSALRVGEVLATGLGEYDVYRGPMAE